MLRPTAIAKIGARMNVESVVSSWIATTQAQTRYAAAAKIAQIGAESLTPARSAPIVSDALHQANQELTDAIENLAAEVDLYA